MVRKIPVLADIKNQGKRIYFPGGQHFEMAQSLPLVRRTDLCSIYVISRPSKKKLKWRPEMQCKYYIKVLIHLNFRSLSVSITMCKEKYLCFVY